MRLSEYLVMFALVVTMGVGVPGAGDASLLATGTLAGEGRLSVRWLLERPGWLDDGAGTCWPGGSPVRTV